ncbi:hypothetical protein C8R43DRAFT_960884 [Mycena crocata]|nr:hypothetical protein C8R43DRAFT_960884 [Mycena crocata]
MKFSISLLALCSAACALSVPSAGSFPPANVSKVVDAEVFLCNAAFFSGYCVAITGETNGGCIDLAADLDNQVSSFGRDQGQRCRLFNHHGCSFTGNETPVWSGFITSPGIQDFSVSWFDADGNLNTPFNDIISSYRSAPFRPKVVSSLTLWFNTRRNYHNPVRELLGFDIY